MHPEPNRTSSTAGEQHEILSFQGMSVLDATEFEPTCTVVVCTRDRPRSLDGCLSALRQLAYPKFDVLVVDNAPSDNRAATVAGKWSARYLLHPCPGLSRARNAGMRASTSEIVAFIDDDARPDSNWLRELAREFQDPTVMAVTGQIRLADQPGEYGPSSNGNGTSHRLHLDRRHPAWFEMANFGGIGNGGNMALRRSSTGFWSGFDERLGRGAPIIGGEEHRVFSELIQNGYSVVYNPKAMVSHPHRERGEEFQLPAAKILEGAIAYTILLLFESQSKLRVLRFVLEATMGKRRTWRSAGPQLREVLPSRWTRLKSVAFGTWLYLRCRALGLNAIGQL